MPHYIFFNGKILKKNEVFLSVEDRGLLYGDGYFETFRSYNDSFYDLIHHYNRIIDTGKFLKIEFPYTFEEFKKILYDLKYINKLNGHHCYIRVTITRGVDPFGPSIKENHKPTIIIILKKLPQYVLDRAQKGVHVTIMKEFVKEKNILYNYKTLNYLPSILGFLSRKKYDDVIFIDKKGNLIEGITANLFFYKGKIIFTSNEKDLFLKGVTRKILIKGLKRSNKYFLRYRNFTEKNLNEIDGAFLTNSLSGIYPILSIDGFKLKHNEQLISNIKKIYFEELKKGEN